jgi:hypothetical protein
MLVIMIVTLIALSFIGCKCIDLLEENKRLRKWKKDRIELDQRLSKEAFENISKSCEDLQKSLEEQSKYFEEKIVQLDGKKIADTVTLEVEKLNDVTRREACHPDQ